MMSENSDYWAKVPSKSPAFSWSSQPSAMFSFTYDDLYKCLYQHDESETANIPANHANSNGHTASLIWPSPLNTAEQNGPGLTYAMKTCPSELELCWSGICGLRYGIRTKQMIPEGTWIGPYQGTVVRPRDFTAGMDTSYMWEIYENGKLSHYIDGSNENNSSWMRFICCARYREEQNLFAFQYNNEIYYRAFTKIPAGVELAVWYEDRYPQFMGIPLSITDIGHLEQCAHQTAPSKAIVMPNCQTQHPDWRKVAPPLREPPFTGRFPSAVMAPTRARFHTPTFFAPNDVQSMRARSVRAIPYMHRRTRGQRGPSGPPSGPPGSSQRVIVLKKANDAPDPFSIFREQERRALLTE